MLARTAIALCALALPVEAMAAEPEPTTTAPPGDDSDVLIEELLESGGQSEAAQDLKWLTSDEPYAPSGLGGRQIPAPAVFERGGGSVRRWDPRWRRFELRHYVVTGASFAVGLGSYLIPTEPNRWRDRLGVDESVRDAIGIRNYGRGVWARDTSDLLLSLSVSFPLLFDSLIVMYWHRDSPDVAEQIALIGAEAMAVTTAVQGLTAGFASRERPYVRDCGTLVDGELTDCAGKKPYRSFFSGHTSLSFAGASVTCSNHLRHDVFGDATADVLTCALAMSVASGTGLMRIVGDQHYASDVAVGAAAGTLIGFGVPWLLHYRPAAPASSGFDVSLVAAPNGVGLGGHF